MSIVKDILAQRLHIREEYRKKGVKEPDLYVATGFDAEIEIFDDPDSASFLKENGKKLADMPIKSILNFSGWEIRLDRRNQKDK